jgi:hypothetical protein
MSSRKYVWFAVATGAGALGAFLVRQGLNQAWKLAREEDPPENPAAWDVDWRDAVAWTLATGVVVGLGRLFALRGAAAGWHRLTGEHPPL